MRHAALACAVFGILAIPLFTAVQTARAEVEFTTFETGDHYNSSSSAVISGPGGFNPGTQAYADEFTASFDGMLSSVQVAVESAGIPDGSDGYLSVKLYLNDPLTNLPGGEITTLGELTATNGVATLTTNAMIVPLVGGVSYWLALEPFDAYTDAAWYSADNANATKSADNNFSGSAMYSAATGAEAFEIDAIPAAAPEPSTWVLLGLGVGLLGLTLRRRTVRA